MELTGADAVRHALVKRVIQAFEAEESRAMKAAWGHPLERCRPRSGTAMSGRRMGMPVKLPILRRRNHEHHR